MSVGPTEIPRKRVLEGALRRDTSYHAELCHCGREEYVCDKQSASVSENDGDEDYGMQSTLPGGSNK